MLDSIAKKWGYEEHENVNINAFPLLKHAIAAKPGATLTKGDLHGNTLVLIHALLLHKYIDMSEQDYQAFVAIYHKDPLQAEDIAEYEGILSRAKFILSDAAIRLIGDILADRGACDYFTLLLLEKLSQAGISFEILLSNHDAVFIEKIEKGDDLCITRLGGGQDASMCRLGDLIKRGIVSRERLVNLYNSIYKPNLKLISYSLNPQENEISIYSHAGIDISNIENIAKELGVNFNDDTPEALAKTIEAINDVFARDFVKQDKISTLVPINDETLPRGTGYNIDAKKYPFVHLIWNRDYHNLARPYSHKGYKVKYVHGHDSSDLTRENIINLDSVLGKLLNYHCGKYNILVNYEKKLTQMSKATATVPAKVAHTPPAIKPRVEETGLSRKPTQQLLAEIMDGNIEGFLGDTPKPIQKDDMAVQNAARQKVEAERAAAAERAKREKEEADRLAALQAKRAREEAEKVAAMEKMRKEQEEQLRLTLESAKQAKEEADRLMAYRAKKALEEAERKAAAEKARIEKDKAEKARLAKKQEPIIEQFDMDIVSPVMMAPAQKSSEEKQCPVSALDARRTITFQQITALQTLMAEKKFARKPEIVQAKKKGFNF